MCVYLPEEPMIEIVQRIRDAETADTSDKGRVNSRSGIDGSDFLVALNTPRESYVRNSAKANSLRRQHSVSAENTRHDRGNVLSSSVATDHILKVRQKIAWQL